MLRAIFCLFALLAMAGTAHADAIDGSWCLDSGERLSINGPTIVTPAGTPLWGNYNRHFFSYEAPKGEPSAGATIQMRLLNENTMQRRAGPDAPVETWHRCSPATS